MHLFILTRGAAFGGTLCDINFLCPETLVMLKLERKAMGHFVMIIEIHVHLIRGISRHTDKLRRIIKFLNSYVSSGNFVPSCHFNS